MNWGRENFNNKKPKVNAIFTSNKNKSKNNTKFPRFLASFSTPTFNTIASAATMVGLGLAIGVPLGMLTNESDAELLQINKNLKSQNINLTNENNSINMEKQNLSRQNENLRLSIESLKKELLNKENLIAEKDKHISSLNENTLNSSKSSVNASVTTKTLSGETKEIMKGETAYFYNNEVYVSLIDIYLKDKITASIGSLAYKNVKMDNVDNGSKVTYKGKNTYEIRLIKISYESATFQVLKLN